MNLRPRILLFAYYLRSYLWRWLLPEVGLRKYVIDTGYFSGKERRDKAVPCNVEDWHVWIRRRIEGCEEIGMKTLPQCRVGSTNTRRK